jgi:outer membrane protein assembly factor BamB
LVIVFHGPGTPSILYGLDKDTGKTVWTSKETAINSPVFGTWSTPLIVKTNSRDELIMPLPGGKIGGPGWFKGYEPATGKTLWQIDGLGNEVYAMPIMGASGKIIVGISGHNGPTMAIRPGGSGDSSESHMLWRTKSKNPQRVGSGVIHGKNLFLADATGILQCLNAETGDLVFRERLGGNLWGSILLAGDRLYVSNLEGDTYVVRAASEFELIAKNSVGEATYAAIAPAHGKLFLRTHKQLYCIGNGSK